MPQDEAAATADMITAAIGQLEAIAWCHRLAARDAAIALCRMLEVAPEPWKKPIAQRLRALECSDIAEIPGGYRRLVRRALNPDEDVLFRTKMQEVTVT